VSVTANMQASARSAISFLTGLLQAASRHQRRHLAPTALEMLTICRETGCKLPELEAHARAMDRAGAVLLCGGDAEQAAEIAGFLGLKGSFQAESELPIVWWVQAGEEEELHFRHGFNETRIEVEALHQLLGKDLGQERLITIHEQTKSNGQWSFAWVPHPAAVEKFLDDSALIELQVEQKIAFIVVPGSAEAMITRLEDIGQPLFQIAASGLSTGEPEIDVEAKVGGVMDGDDDEHQERIDTAWSWLQPRLLEQTEITKQQYGMMIDRQTNKLSVTSQLLREYRRNWVSGIRNETDSYLQKRTRGKAFEPFWDAKSPGPETASFITAMSVSSLRQRHAKTMTDRMAEFVAGLSALATKVELRKIPLQEMNTRWNPADLSEKIESALVKHRVFTEGGGPRAGIVGSLTGKSGEIVDTRKGQVLRAGRYVVQTVENEFAIWCDRLMRDVEHRVQVQLAADLANQGLPDADALRTAISGLDRLAKMIRGDTAQESSRPETVAGGWLTMLSQRRLIPRFRSSQTV